MVLSLPGRVTWSKLTNLCELLQPLIGGDQPECLIGRGRFRNTHPVAVIAGRGCLSFLSAPRGS